MRKNYDTSQRTRLEGYDGGLKTGALQDFDAGWDYSPDSRTHRLHLVEDGVRYYAPVSARCHGDGRVTAKTFTDDGVETESKTLPSLHDAKTELEIKVRHAIDAGDAPDPVHDAPEEAATAQA